MSLLTLLGARAPSPTTTLPFSETWTGATGTAWPAAWSVGNIPASGTNGSATIQANAGALTAPSSTTYSGYRAYLNSTFTNFDASVTVTPSTQTEAYFLLGGSSDLAQSSNPYNPQNAYAIQISLNSGGSAATSVVKIFKMLGGTQTVLGTALTTTVTAGVAYGLRLQVNGTAVRGKFWDTTVGSEPTAWTFDTVDTGTRPPAGTLVMHSGNGNAAAAYTWTVDNLSLSDPTVSANYSVSVPLSGTGGLSTISSSDQFTPQYSQDWDGGSGSQGTAITTANTGGTGETAITSTVMNSPATMTFDNTVSHSGTYSLLVNHASTSTAAYAVMTAGAALGTRFAVREYFYFPSGYSFASIVYYLEFRDSTGTQIAVFGNSTASSWFVGTSGATGAQISGLTLSTQTWYRIEAAVTTSGSAGAATLELAIYAGDSTTALGSATLTNASLSTTTAISTVRLGWSSQSTQNHWRDDWAADTTLAQGAFIGSSNPPATAAPNFSSSGALGLGSGMAALSGSAVLGGAGVLSSPQNAMSVSGLPNLSGSGALTPSVTTIGVASAPAALAGSGSLTSTVLLKASVTTTFTGTGVLTSAATPNAPGSSTLSGSGALATGAAKPGPTQTTALSGAGTIATGTRTPRAAQSTPLSGSGLLAAGPRAATTGSAALSGAGVLAPGTDIRQMQLVAGPISSTDAATWSILSSEVGPTGQQISRLLTGPGPYAWGLYTAADQNGATIPAGSSLQFTLYARSDSPADFGFWLTNDPSQDSPSVGLTPASVSVTPAWQQFTLTTTLTEDWPGGSTYRLRAPGKQVQGAYLDLSDVQVAIQAAAPALAGSATLSGSGSLATAGTPSVWNPTNYARLGDRNGSTWEGGPPTLGLPDPFGGSNAFSLTYDDPTNSQWAAPHPTYGLADGLVAGHTYAFVMWLRSGDGSPMAIRFSGEDSSDPGGGGWGYPQVPLDTPWQRYVQYATVGSAPNIRPLLYSFSGEEYGRTLNAYFEGIYDAAGGPPLSGSGALSAMSAQYAADTPGLSGSGSLATGSTAPTVPQATTLTGAGALTARAPDVYTETWTGADGDPWPSQWEALTRGTQTVPASISILNNAGHIDSGSGQGWGYSSGWAQLHDVPVGDVDLVVDVALTVPAPGDEGYAMLFLSTSDDFAASGFPHNGAEFDFGYYQGVWSIDVGTQNNGTQISGPSVPFSGAIGAPFRFHIRQSGQHVWANVWPKGSTEPAGWMLDWVDPSIPVGGKVRFGAMAGSMDAIPVTVDYDNLTVRSTAVALWNTSSLSGTGSVSASGAAAALGTTNLAGSGALSTLTTATAAGAPALSGLGALTSSAVGSASGMAAFTSSGSLTTSAQPALLSAVGLSGGGVLSSSNKISASGSVSLAGTGALAASALAAAGSTAALAGSGTLTDSTKISAPGSATLASSGTLTVGTTVSVGGSATLAGTGTLAAAGAPRPQTAPTLSGAGALTTTTRLTASASTALTGSGSLIANTAGSGQSTPSLAGAGTLNAAATTGTLVTPALAGAGTLTTGASTPAPRSASSMLGTGTLATGVGTPALQSATALQGAGTLTTGAGTPAPRSTTALGGAGSLTTGSGISTLLSASALTGTGTLSTSGGLPTLLSATALQGTGSLTTGLGTPAPRVGSALQGTGTLISGGSPATAGPASLGGTGTLTASVRIATAASATFSSVGALAALTTQLFTSGLNLSGDGALSLTNIPALVGSTGLIGLGTLTLASTEATSAGADFSGTGTLIGFELPGGLDLPALYGAGTLNARTTIGRIKVWLGQPTGFQAKQIYVYQGFGIGWQVKPLKFWDGSQWVATQY